jgi:hypothetical protein
MKIDEAYKQYIYKQYILFPCIDTSQLQNAASASISRPPPQRFCSSRCAPIRLRIDPIPAARRRQDSSKNFCDHIVCCAAEGRRERIILLLPPEPLYCPNLNLINCPILAGKFLRAKHPKKARYI